eukprot:13436534-Ditylum_brightwellii.AAC.1
MQQQKEQTDQMEAMMQQLLTSEDHNQRNPTMMAHLPTPSPAMMQYQNMPYTQMSSNIQPVMPPLQPIHMQNPPAPIGNFHSQPYTQQNTSPTNDLLSSQGSLDYQGEHLTQNNHVEHKIDLGANCTKK